VIFVGKTGPIWRMIAIIWSEDITDIVTKKNDSFV